MKDKYISTIRNWRKYAAWGFKCMFKTITYLLAIFLFTCIFSCRECQKKHAISKIEVASDGGELPFNGHVLSIDSSLNCSFYGGSNFKKSGFFRGRISNELWEHINEKLEQIAYKTAPASDDVSTPDAEYLEIIIYNSSSKKRLVRCNCGKKTHLLKVINWILMNYINIPLKMAKDSIKFGTTFQNSAVIPRR